MTKFNGDKLAPISLPHLTSDRVWGVYVPPPPSIGARSQSSIRAMTPPPKSCIFIHLYALPLKGAKTVGLKKIDGTLAWSLLSGMFFYHTRIGFTLKSNLP